MRVLVCGGRDYADKDALFRALDSLHDGESISIVIHGACVDRDNHLRGADGLAEAWAISREIPYCGYPAKWKALGRSAGPERNFSMLERSRPHVVLAAPGGRGTADMIRRAKAADLRVVEILA
jgi:hypothetical protein